MIINGTYQYLTMSPTMINVLNIVTSILYHTIFNTANNGINAIDPVTTSNTISSIAFFLSIVFTSINVC